MKLKKIDLQNESEVKFVYDVRCHPDVDKWLFGSRPVNFESHKKHLESNERVFIIYDDIPIGYCSYKESGEEIEVGWKIHPDYQNKGYGVKSVPMLISKIRSKKNIVLYVVKNNNRALAVYQKAGFRLVNADEQSYKMEKI